MDALKTHGLKIAIGGVLVAVVAAFFVFDLQQYLTLEYLKSSRDQFQSYYVNQPFVTVATYMILYIAMAAFSLPGAAVVTLAGGAMFGTITGTIIVSFASTIGATCAMLIARTLFRETIQDKFKDQIAVIDKGIEKDGAYYLFTLRLVPVVPFFVINAGMGLVNIKAFTFFWVSQIGMLAGTIVYVNAGSQLAAIDSLKDVASPKLLISFALLGVMPLVLKKVVALVESRRAKVTAEG